MIAYTGGSATCTSTGDTVYWIHINYDDYYYCDSYGEPIDIQEEPEIINSIKTPENYLEKENFKYIQARHSVMRKNTFKNVTFKRQL